MEISSTIPNARIIINEEMNAGTDAMEIRHGSTDAIINIPTLEETGDENRAARIKKRLNKRNQVHAIGAAGVNSGLLVNNLSQVCLGAPWVSS